MRVGVVVARRPQRALAWYALLVATSRNGVTAGVVLVPPKTKNAHATTIRRRCEVLDIRPNLLVAWNEYLPVLVLLLLVVVILLVVIGGAGGGAAAVLVLILVDWNGRHPKLT